MQEPVAERGCLNVWVKRVEIAWRGEIVTSFRLYVNLKSASISYFFPIRALLPSQRAAQADDTFDRLQHFVL
jgi:hypothetical protein